MENSQGYFMSMNFRLKIGLLTALMGCAGYVGAQTSPIVSQPAAGGALLTSDALDQILKPIALYPDPLLAEVFTAATLPSQIVLADRYIAQGGDVNAAALEPWDSSVQALVHYPTVLKWLDDNLAWTTDVGQAFLNQQQDVMNSIQRLRSQAQDEGNLQSTPQENVVADAGTVEIEPTDPAVIYVPIYPWDTIYDDPGIYCTFGIGFPIGPWLGYDWDWRNHHVIAWGAGHPRPGDWWRRTPGNRQAPQGVPIWHPASRVAASASRGADRGFSAETLWCCPRAYSGHSRAARRLPVPGRDCSASRHCGGVWRHDRRWRKTRGCPTGSRSGGGGATGNRVKASGPDPASCRGASRACSS
jgi:hypothetical protein